MKKTLFLIFAALFCFSNFALAEDIYCGDLNGKPVYLRTESINEHLVKDDGTYSVYADENEISIYPEYDKYFRAHLIYKENLYDVCFSESTTKSFSIKQLTGNHESPISSSDFSFAYGYVKSNYNHNSPAEHLKYWSDYNNKKDSERMSLAIKQTNKENLATNITVYDSCIRNASPSVITKQYEKEVIKNCKGLTKEDAIEATKNLNLSPETLKFLYSNFN